jgi:hypothetical protein
MLYLQKSNVGVLVLKRFYSTPTHVILARSVYGMSMVYTRIRLQYTDAVVINMRKIELRIETKL